MSPDPPLAQGTPARLVFSCPSCGLRLSAGAEHVGVTGPCPSCGSPVTAPGGVAKVQEGPLEDLKMPEEAPNGPGVEVIPPAFARRGPRSPDFRRDSSGRRRGRIVPDSIVDRQHLSHRETMKSLFVIVVFILALGVCLAVTWFFKDQAGQ